MKSFKEMFSNAVGLPDQAAPETEAKKAFVELTAEEIWEMAQTSPFSQMPYPSALEIVKTVTKALRDKNGG
jgi:hypothetical protein